ncbi:MAG: alpha/beta hydrolase family protein [Myxococcales bacterium]|nr:alpha/beta hydrolase family protein [Myxococcales bacterium]
MRIPVAGFTLEGQAHLVDGAPAAIVCHPHPAFGGRMDNPLVVALAEACHAAGFSTVRFNFRGLDGSEGTPTGGRAEHEDVAAVIAWMRAQGAARIALVGYSFGALMAARAVADGADVTAFAAVGFPTTLLGEDPDRVGHLEAALDRRVPWLFIGGDADQFCEIDRLDAWVAGRPWAKSEVLSGRGHFLSGSDAVEVCERVARFTWSATCAH